MKTKKCTQCGIEKNNEHYYKAKKSPDGLHTICKKCILKRAVIRYNALRLNPEWIEQERKRGREKHKRLKYKNNYSPTKAAIKNIKQNSKFPEKVLAKNKSRGLQIKNGFDKHHWSYNQEHYKDILYLKYNDHARLHRFIIYDQERKMYRRCDTMQLLDTKEKHLNYFEGIKDKK